MFTYLKTPVRNKTKNQNTYADIHRCKTRDFDIDFLVDTKKVWGGIAKGEACVRAERGEECGVRDEGQRSREPAVSIVMSIKYSIMSLLQSELKENSFE